MVQDAQPSIAELTFDSLADRASSAYRLRRVVGKIWCGIDQFDQEGVTSEVVVTAGLIVLRTHEVAGEIVPLNATTEEYSTQMLQNWSDPWIWRRSWLLGNIPNETVGAFAFFPEANATYGGGNQDAAHVDAKTARIVGTEERLFLVVTGSSVNGNPQVSITLRLLWDLRVLASMRTSQGNRRNASR